ncbi:PucR family transcriptional regulator [Rugosimonospora africana]|uniref:Putative transcriptional regulator n=1 Tax=Rugosimonospora africana TaxID=556532 RepID=A0A8J3R392_9ACTN|nr:helix-turn-helix domain-containing protein [Rugosimonospora africana]GIH21014.1 putative transcriptional regulator [Rugosimonospora africana]
MGALFGVLRAQIEANAQQAVEIFTSEVPEYEASRRDVIDRDDMVDFAVFIRRRTLDLAANGRPLEENDLSTFAEAGRIRAEAALTLASQQRVVDLHTGRLLHEIRAASGPNTIGDLLRLVGWLGAQGVRARAAYLNGYLDGADPPNAVAGRMELLAQALIADEPVEWLPVDGLGVPMSDRYAVSVLRIPSPVPASQRHGVSHALADRRLVTAWLAPDELVILTPLDGASEDVPLEQVRSTVVAIGRACQVGSVDGVIGHLAESLSLARGLSRVAPLEDKPARRYAVADLFAELSVAGTPQIDTWLGGFAQRLAAGPSLVETLYAYYCHDMGRLATASALIIHPRTLDYRLQRVRDITGLDPASTAGVRILSVVVARIRARELF